MGIGLSMLIGAVLTGIAGLTSTIITNNQSSSNQGAAQNFNAEQAQIQRQWETPANQMQLYKDAGINPATAAQGITGVTGSGAMAQSAQGAPVMPMDWSFLQNAVNDYYSNKNLEALANKTNKETGWIDTLNSTQRDKLLQDIKESKSRVDLNDSQKNSLDVAAKQLVRMNDAKIKEIQANTNNLISFNEQINAVTNKTNKESEVLDKDIELKNKSMDKMDAEIANINQSTEESKSREKLNYQNLAESAARCGLIETEKLLKNSEINLNDAKTLIELQNAIINDYKVQCAKYGFYPDSGWINNIMSIVNNDLKGVYQNHVKGSYDKFNQAINDMFSGIESFFNDINKGKERDSTKNIYGKSWNNPNSTSWYNE